MHNYLIQLLEDGFEVDVEDALGKCLTNFVVYEGFLVPPIPLVESPYE